MSSKLSYSLALIPLFASTLLAQTASPTPDTFWKPVEEAMGRSGQPQPDGVYKFSMPRRDLSVSVDGVQLNPALALGSWVAFTPAGKSASIMGDLVVTEDEVAPVMRKLEANKIHVTALHNHLLHESPRVMYMHIHGYGTHLALARAVREALAETGTSGPDAAPPAPAQDLGIDIAQIEQALGRKGKTNGGVLQFAVPRAHDETEVGTPVIKSRRPKIPASMGLSTALNFQPTGGGRAAVTGDFVLFAAEVDLVLQALTANGIAVTALHSHMLQEEPRLFFMHFWANDDALKLAQGLRAALDKTDSKK